MTIFSGVSYQCKKARKESLAVPEGEDEALSARVAAALVYSCEGRSHNSKEKVDPENGECPEDCQVRMLAERRV